MFRTEFILTAGLWIIPLLETSDTQVFPRLRVLVSTGIPVLSRDDRSARNSNTVTVRNIARWEFVSSAVSLQRAYLIIDRANFVCHSTDVGMGKACI